MMYGPKQSTRRPHLICIYVNLIGFCRAARTRLFRLINTQNRALCALSPTHHRSAVLLFYIKITNNKKILYFVLDLDTETYSEAVYDWSEGKSKNQYSRVPQRTTDSHYSRVN